MGEGSMGTAYGLTLAVPPGPLMKSLLVSYRNYSIFGRRRIGRWKTELDLVDPILPAC
jgi:hypothetical protein